MTLLNPSKYDGCLSYDARLLLTSLPDTSTHKASEKLVAEDGWDDLPSDSEDLFCFSINEADDIRREKRRRLVEFNHRARLLAIKAADSEEPPINNWGSDEEVAYTQCSRMTRFLT